LAVFLAEQVHALAGGLYFLRSANALRQVVQGFLELRSEIGRDADGGFGGIHGIAPYLLSLTIHGSLRKLKSATGKVSASVVFLA
jgi:hypothetical protein